MGTGREDCGPSLMRLMQTQTTRLRRRRRGVWLSLCATAGCPRAKFVNVPLSGRAHHCLCSNGSSELEGLITVINHLGEQPPRG